MGENRWNYRVHGSRLGTDPFGMGGPSAGVQQIWALFDLATMPIEGTFEEQLEPFVAACAELFRASGASLFLADRAARSYQLVAKCGDQVKAPIGATIRAGQGIAGACIQSRKPMLVTDPSADPRLRDVAARPEFQWEFNVIVDDKTVNAWCMPGGKVAVYTGLLPITRDETGLAVVMGHEVAHAIAKLGR